MSLLVNVLTRQSRTARPRAVFGTIVSSRLSRFSSSFSTPPNVEVQEDSVGSSSSFKIRRVGGPAQDVKWVRGSRKQRALQRQRDPRPQLFRFARLFGLDPSLTHLDIVQGLIETAPVGRVLSVDVRDRIYSHKGKETKAAFVLFDHDAAPQDLVRLAKEGSFLVRGQQPHVAVYHDRAFSSNDSSELSSRVLHLRGPGDVGFFSDEKLRELLLGNENVARALGPLGLSSEPVEWHDFPGGQRLMEWRFFDNRKQVKVLLPILRRLFHGSLVVNPGPDPCWNKRLYPRTNHSTEASSVEDRTERRAKRSPPKPALALDSAESTPVKFDPDSLGYRLAQIIAAGVLERHAGAQGDSTARESKGGALDEGQKERVKAWTQLSQGQRYQARAKGDDANDAGR